VSLGRGTLHASHDRSAGIASQVQPQSSLFRAIDDYLRGHPDAYDSLEGVQEWWLNSPAQRAAMVSTEELEAVLTYFVTVGRLKKIRLADGEVLYLSMD
jgi:hypothetical protein